MLKMWKKKNSFKNQRDTIINRLQKEIINTQHPKILVTHSNIIVIDEPAVAMTHVAEAKTKNL
jgi:hypothetical protein